MGEVRKMDLSTMAARWERIEREKDGGPPALSFDHAAARAFQEYVGAYMAFSAKRGGIMYGTVLEDGTVRVEAIYEPRQHGSPLSLAFEVRSVEAIHKPRRTAASMAVQQPLLSTEPRR